MMKTLTMTIALVAMGILAIRTFAPGATETSESWHADQSAKSDQVVASFERDMNRQPGPAAPVTREAIEDDILYKEMNEILWTPDAVTEAETEERQPDESDGE